MKTVVYLHGQPGAQCELELSASFVDRFEGQLFVPDRSASEGVSFSDHMDAVAETVSKRAAGHPIHIVGFSVGAFVAMELAARLGNGVSRLDLISAAAPLQVGDFLPSMAGAPVFSLALNNPENFVRLTQGQALVVRVAPWLLRSVLMKNAKGLDAQLSKTAAFRRVFDSAIREAMVENQSAYLRDITAYVQDWSSICAQVTAPTYIWHGTSDNWCPPQMAKALSAMLPNVHATKWLPEGSHFSTFKFTLDAISKKDQS